MAELAVVTGDFHVTNTDAAPGGYLLGAVIDLETTRIISDGHVKITSVAHSSGAGVAGLDVLIAAQIDPAAADADWSAIGYSASHPDVIFPGAPVTWPHGDDTDAFPETRPLMLLIVARYIRIGWALTNGGGACTATFSLTASAR